MACCYGTHGTQANEDPVLSPPLLKRSIYLPMENYGLQQQDMNAFFSYSFLLEFIHHMCMKNLTVLNVNDTTLPLIGQI